MDAAIAADALDRLVVERARASAPERFPVLPDLPLGRYTDPRFFGLELERVFEGGWLLVGHESEVPGPGAFVTVDLGRTHLVVVRGADDEIRSFRNACRHRGAPVVRSGTGVARRLVCQFHSWSYDLEGNLVAIPGERDFVGLCPEDRALGRVRTETWNGFVFVNPDGVAAPLAGEIESISRRFDPFFTQDLRLVERRSYDVACNWKVVMEAFLEVYHLRTVHRDTASRFAVSEAPAFGLHPGGHSTMYMSYSDEIVEADAASPVRQLMFPSDLPAPEGLPDIFATTNVLFSLFPNVVAPLSPQGFPVVQPWPLASDRTRFDVSWYGTDWGEGDRPAGWDMKLAAWDLVLAEDLRNLEPIQRSLASAAHGGIPLGYQEQAIYHLHSAIDDRIGRGEVPSGLAAPPVLTGLVER